METPYGATTNKKERRVTAICVHTVSAPVDERPLDDYHNIGKPVLSEPAYNQGVQLYP